ncbi:hypothetical protein ABPG77_009576 [Micractinium sp. CCAP 211/92]
MDARIVNGRAGSSSGASTSFGVRGTANSVVDYFIVPATYLQQVCSLLVDGAVEERAADHSRLTLCMAAELAPTPAAPVAETDPCLMRFPFPLDPEHCDAAAACLAASPMLPALTAAAERASNPAEVAAIAQQRCLAVAAACAAAGIRPAGSARVGHQPNRSGISASTAERFRLRALKARPYCRREELRARMEAPFTTDEIIALVRRTPLRKSVVGPLAPWLLKQCLQLAPLIAAEFNAWRRAGGLPPSEALSAIALVAKLSTPTGPTDFRGIAVGALLAKLYAAALEQQVSDHAEAAGVHAEGQFGFRHGRSTEQAVLALRTVVDSQRQQWRRQRQRMRRAEAQPGRRDSGQLWACFVDFKKAYDRVPRERLWEQLSQLGYGGEWLRAVRAIYASVPMTVSMPGLEGRRIYSTQGLKQGCPLSPPYSPCT